MKSAVNLGLFVLGFTLVQSTAYASFPDVPTSHANYDAIMYVQAKGIVNGYSDGTFRPDATINRAEFVKILIETHYAGINGPGPDECLQDQEWIFPDVHHTHWFAPYVCVASNIEFVSGYLDGTFKPNNNINFAEAAKILVKAFFEFDEPSIDSPWYAPPVTELGIKHAIPLSIQSFNQFITRGEMAEMIYRLKVPVTNKSSKTYDELATNISGPWALYTDNINHFSVQYPQEWIMRDWGENNDFPGWRTQWFGFGPVTTIQGGLLWGVSFHKNASGNPDLETIIKRVGNQFTDQPGEERYESRKEIMINGQIAMQVIVTTNVYADFKEENIFLQTDDGIYQISNGGSNDLPFEKFSQSFKLLGQTSFSSNTKEYLNTQEGFDFTYPSQWPLPVMTDGTLTDANGTGRADWTLNMSPCKGCAEGEDTYNFSVHGLPASLANKFVAALEKDDMARKMQESTATPGEYGMRLVTFDVGGMCGNKVAYWIGKKYALAIEGRCAADSTELSRIFDHLVSSFGFYATFSSNH